MIRYGTPRAAWVCGDDGALGALLSEVLAEAGLVAHTGPPPFDLQLVLVHVAGPWAIGRLQRMALQELPTIPVVAILPFDDTKLGWAAMKAGARGVYALGTPLDQLRELIHEVMR